MADKSKAALAAAGRKARKASEGPAGNAAVESSANNAPELPRSAREISSILSDMSVSNAKDLRVLGLLLEFSHRYIHDVLEDAQRFAEHRSAAETVALTKEDVRLAVASRLDCSFAAPPPREMLLEIASERNANPLPAVADRPGIRLPLERYCLLKPNYIVQPYPPGSREEAERDGPLGVADSSMPTALRAAAQASLNRKKRRLMEEARRMDEQTHEAQQGGPPMGVAPGGGGGVAVKEEAAPSVGLGMLPTQQDLSMKMEGTADGGQDDFD